MSSPSFFNINIAFTPRNYLPKILNIETQKAVTSEKVRPSTVHYALDSVQIAKPRFSAVPNKKTSLRYHYTSYNYSKNTIEPTDL